MKTSLLTTFWSMFTSTSLQVYDSEDPLQMEEVGAGGVVHC